MRDPLGVAHVFAPTIAIAPWGRDIRRRPRRATISRSSIGAIAIAARLQNVPSHPALPFHDFHGRTTPLKP